MKQALRRHGAVVLGVLVATAGLAAWGIWGLWDDAKGGNTIAIAAATACVVVIVFSVLLAGASLLRTAGDVAAQAGPRPDLWVVSLTAFLAATITGAGLVLNRFWEPAKSSVGSPSGDVVKACIAVITVAVLGAAISLLTGALEASRKRRAELEVQWRESFTVLSELLDRSTRCAHSFYVTCQHVYRQRKKADSATSVTERSSILTAADSLLNTEYLAFSTEAETIETQIKARFGEHQPTSRYDYDKDPDGEVGGEQSWWRWHMVSDLLTIYYFALQGNFPGESLINNSTRTVEGEGHVCSGYRAIDIAAEAKKAAKAARAAETAANEAADTAADEEAKEQATKAVEEAAREADKAVEAAEEGARALKQTAAKNASRYTNDEEASLEAQAAEEGLDAKAEASVKAVAAERAVWAATKAAWVGAAEVSLKEKARAAAAAAAAAARAAREEAASADAKTSAANKAATAKAPNEVVKGYVDAAAASALQAERACIKVVGTAPTNEGEANVEAAKTLEDNSLLVVTDQKAPEPEELIEIIRAVRARIPKAVTKFTLALRQEEWRDLPGGRGGKSMPAAGVDPAGGGKVAAKT